MANNPFYTRLQGTATRLLTRFGNPQHLQYITVIEGEEDPEFGDTEITESDPVDLIGVVTRIDNNLINQKTILPTDKMVVVDRAVYPQAPNYFLIGGVRHTILQDQPIDPAGQPLVYRVVVRIGSQ